MPVSSEGLYQDVVPEGGIAAIGDDGGITPIFRPTETSCSDCAARGVPCPYESDDYR
jgi:hypothetical protein